MINILIYLAFLLIVICIGLLLYGQTANSLFHTYVGMFVGIAATILIITACFIP